MDTTELFAAIDAASLEQVDALLAQEPALAAARNEHGVSAVLYTLYRREAALTERLLAEEPPLDVFDAAALGRLERLGELLDADPAALDRCASDGFSPLHLACFFSGPEAVGFLCDRGADVSLRSGAPMLLAPLHSAAASGNVESCRILLERGASPDAEQQGGWTALHSAAQHGNGDLARLLLAHGASAAVRAQNGKTPLDLARDAGHTELAELLARD